MRERERAGVSGGTAMFAQIDFKVYRNGYLCISRDINNSIDSLMVNGERDDGFDVYSILLQWY